MRLTKVKKPMLDHLYLCVTRHNTIFLSECSDGTKRGDRLTFVDRVYANVYEWNELKEIYFVDRANAQEKEQMARLPRDTRQLNDSELIESQDRFTDNYVDYLGVTHTMIGKPAGDFLCVIRSIEAKGGEAKVSNIMNVNVKGVLLASEKSDAHKLHLMQELFIAEKMGYGVYVDGVRRDRNWIYEHYNVISLITIKGVPMSEEEFHKKRVMFFLYGDTMMVYGGKDGLTHKEWLADIFNDVDSLIEEHPRGYVLDGVLAIYRGKDFKDDISLMDITVIGNMMRGYDTIKHIHLGAIPGPDQPWKPKRCLSREDIRLMQDEQGYPG